LAGIARAIGVSDSWLQTYVNACYVAVPKTAEVIFKGKGKLKVQMTGYGRSWITKATSSECDWR